MRYAPEPWYFTGRSIRSRTDDRRNIAEMGLGIGYLPSDGDELNAQRIVACVNACEEIPTEALDQGVLRNKEVKAALRKAIDQMGEADA